MGAAPPSWDYGARSFCRRGLPRSRHWQRRPEGGLGPAWKRASAPGTVEKGEGSPLGEWRNLWGRPGGVRRRSTGGLRMIHRSGTKVIVLDLTPEAMQFRDQAFRAALTPMEIGPGRAPWRRGGHGRRSRAPGRLEQIRNRSLSGSPETRGTRFPW